MRAIDLSRESRISRSQRGLFGSACNSLILVGKARPLNCFSRPQQTKHEITGPWSSTGVEVERLAFLIGIQYQLEVSMGEENPPPQPRVCCLPCQSLHPLNKLGTDRLRPESIDQFVVIDPFVAIRLNFPRSNNLSKSSELF